MADGALQQMGTMTCWHISFALLLPDVCSLLVYVQVCIPCAEAP